MNPRTKLSALLATGVVLLAGCASTSAMTSPRPGGGMAMTPGMVMPDGSTMGAGDPAHDNAADGPSAAEKMVCAAETRSDIATILGLKGTPTAAATWRAMRYTCTYRLPMGTLVVSVRRADDAAMARVYFNALRRTLSGAHGLDGLGQASFGITNGKVVLVKDNDTLIVDATRLPRVLGAQQARRFDFAYELASNILGCWTEG